MTPMKNVAGVALALALSGPQACKGPSPGVTAGTAGTVGTVGTADGGSNVQLWPGITEETSPSDLSTAWTAPWLNGSFSLKEGSLPGHTPRQLTRCADLAGVAEADVVLGPGWEHYNFREKSVRCRVVGTLRTAHAARIGYARDLVDSDDPGDLLPAAVAPGGGAEGGAARSWRAADPTVKFDREGARGGYHELIVRGAYRGRMTWWAAGDIDGDGIEDVVMFSNLTPNGDGGSDRPNIMRAFVLTRREPGGAVKLVEQFE
jgi:hypothetical protein